MSDQFLGELRLVGFNYAPKGWALCWGQLMAISQNTALFSLLGTTYGGNGTTTFALPDLQGRTALQVGQGPGLPSYDQGETGGQAAQVLTVAQLPPHNHQLSGTSDPATTANPAGALLATGGSYAGGGGTTMAPGAIVATGGGQPFPTMPPYLVLNWIIALQGIFPPRG